MASREYPGKGFSKENDIRLIELHPGREGDHVVVTLFNCDLADAPAYEALSYVWGDASRIRSISVINSGKRWWALTRLRQLSSLTGRVFGAKRAVTRNCHEALLRLRKPDRPRVLWIDSICIDQDSVRERTHQLNLIAQIYSAASQVIIHLGAGTEETEIALDFIKDLHSPKPPGDATSVWATADLRNPDYIRDALEELFEHPWFHRIRVLQEVRYAKAATLNFKVFLWWNTSEAVVSHVPYPVQATTLNVVRRQEIPYDYRLLDILIATRRCGASDPRDKVFAVLPLLYWEEREFRDHKLFKMQAEPKNGVKEASHVEEPSMAPQTDTSIAILKDYSVSTTQLFTMLTEQLINVFGLSMLYELVLPVTIPGLPSWVIDWSKDKDQAYFGDHEPYYEIPTKLLRFGSEHGSLFTTSEPTRHLGPPSRLFYFSDELQTLQVQANPLEVTRIRQLHVSHLALGRITGIGDLADVNNDDLPISQWETLLQDSPTLLSKFPRALGDGWDMAAAIRRIKDYYGEDWAEEAGHFQDSQIGHHENSMREWHLNDDLECNQNGRNQMRLRDIFAGLPSSLRSMMEMIFYCCHDRRFVVLDTGRIGLVSAQAEVGDQLVAIEGTDVLFVVRAELGGANAVRITGHGFVLGIEIERRWNEPRPNDAEVYLEQVWNGNRQDVQELIIV